MAREFAPDPRRPGWSRCAIPHGELRVETEWLDKLEEIGLLDPDRWRREDLAGVTVQRKPDRWVRCVPGKEAALFAKYRRGARRAEWLEELLHGRRPRSAAAREERARKVLEKVGVATPHIVLAGEIENRLHVERESFLVTRELVDFEPIRGVPWDELAPGLRALIRRLSERRVAVPDLYAKHLFSRGSGAAREFALVDLLRVEPATLRAARSLFVRHAGALAATVPGADAGELALERPELVPSIRERAGIVRARKKLPPDYAARERYRSPEAVARYRSRSARRNARELALLERLLPPRIAGAVVDAPCGAGRLSPLLSGRGGDVLSLDISAAMANDVARSGGRALVGELERLPLADRSCAGAVCFRFLHHVPTRAARGQVLAELARVSRDFVLVSFFRPLSLHHFVRRVRTLIGRPSARHACDLREIEEHARAAGWRVDAVEGETPYLRDLWVARLVPVSSP